LKILHLSHEGLPDWRVEKSAITATRHGHQVIFCGKGSNYKTTLFQKIYQINWNAKARFGVPLYWKSVKRQLAKVLDETRPDIVHAHNIFSARMISEFKLPFVYDDHEFWSASSRLLNEMKPKSDVVAKSKTLGHNFLELATGTRKKIVNRYAIKLWARWEKEIVCSAPTITVSDASSNEMRKLGSSKLFVVPNFPLSSETSNMEGPRYHQFLSSVYAGSDGLNIDRYPHRNMTGFTDVFETNGIGTLTVLGWKNNSTDRVKFKGYLSRQEMFNEMSNHSIGLLPWRKHWAHFFTNPNKPYEYAHAGLFVMCSSSVQPVIRTLQDHCSVFDDYDEMVSQLLYFKNHLDLLYEKRQESYRFAKANIIWEKHENNILQAYQLS
jgi:glycosyltransferase involved in cell wall biosynthesis